VTALGVVEREIPGQSNTPLARKRGDWQRECVGRSKGGLTTKIHATYDALGNPTGFHLTPEQTHDLHSADALLPSILLDNIQALLADKAYDAREKALDLLEQAEVEGVIPRQNPTAQTNGTMTKTSMQGGI